MESANHKAQAIFNEIKVQDLDFQNKVVTQLHALIYDDRRQRMLRGLDDQRRLLESLAGLSSLPMTPEDVGPQKAPADIIIVKDRQPESTTNETTSDPS